MFDRWKANRKKQQEESRLKKEYKKAIYELRSAVEYDNNLDAVIEIVKQYGSVSDVVNSTEPYRHASHSKGKSILYQAVRKGDVGIVRALLEAPAINPNYGDDFGRVFFPRVIFNDIDDISPLLLAIDRGMSNIALELMQHPKIDINLPTPELKTPLIKAAESFPDFLPELLKIAAINVNAADKSGGTALHYLCSRFAATNKIFKPDLLLPLQKLLTFPGINLNAQDNHGWTALMYAARAGDLQLVNELLNAGASPDIKNVTGCVAADLASLYRHDELAKLLRAKSAGVQAAVTLRR